MVHYLLGKKRPIRCVIPEVFTNAMPISMSMVKQTLLSLLDRQTGVKI